MTSHGPEATSSLLTHPYDAATKAPRYRRTILLPPDFPTIVCLCGSTRRALEAFRNSMLAETLAGRIVLPIGSVTQDNDELGITEKQKAELDDLHMRKIDLTDEVLILNVGGYIGESTQRELNYALAVGKRVRFLEPVTVIEYGRPALDSVPRSTPTASYEKISGILTTLPPYNGPF